MCEKGEEEKTAAAAHSAESVLKIDTKGVKVNVRYKVARIQCVCVCVCAQSNGQAFQSKEKSRT